MTRPVRWYLVFVGLTTQPRQAHSKTEARDLIIAEYDLRGIRLLPREVRVRRATAEDEGWLRDSGAVEVADAVSA